jgi:hypothetical protein
MTSLATAMWFHDGQDPPIGTMVRAMAAALIEQHESLVSQQGIHLGEPDVPRRVLHLRDQILSPRQLSFSLNPRFMSGVMTRRRSKTQHKAGVERLQRLRQSLRPTPTGVLRRVGACG